MEPTIRERLLQLNPWLLEPGCFATEVQRRIPAALVRRSLPIEATPRGRARLIVGPRQAGKSTLVWTLLADRPPLQVLFLNAEEERVRTWLGSPAGVLADLASELPSVRTVFIDEAQHLDEAGLLVKGLVDSGRGLEIFVTGSSSFHLGARTRESLAGRATRFRLLPFSLEELLEDAMPPTPAAVRIRARAILDRQLILGCYPGVWTSQEPSRELADLVEAFVLRDASDRFRVQRPDAFRRLMQLAAVQIGQMANFSEWASILGIAASTVREYLELLEETWIVHLLPAFAGGRRREITTAPRVHMYDLGLRNSVLGQAGGDPDRRPDRGALLEGWVFGELTKCLPSSWVPHYWRTKGGAEVDFVLANAGRTIAIEVKGTPRGRATRSQRSFVEAYAPEAFIVAVATGESREQEEGSTRILHVPLVDLSATVRRLIGGP